MGQGSSRVLGYKESQANNVLSHVSHGDLTAVAIAGKRVLLPISSDPSSNVFSAAPYLHVYFSPASATIPDVVETNSSCTGRKLTSRPTRKGIHIPLFLLSLRVCGQPASRLDLEEKQMVLPRTRIEGDRQRSPVYEATNSLFSRMRRVEMRFKSKWTALVKLPAPWKW